MHDVGQSDPIRSHFEAMRELERAAPGSGVRSGWMDRLLATLPRTSAFTGAQVGTAKATDAFRGTFPEIALRSIDSFTLAGVDAAGLPALQTLYRSLYAKAPEVVRPPMSVALDAVSTTARLKAAGYAPSHGVTYPTTAVGQALRDVARLITSASGTRVACVDVNDWDLHAGMGTADSGKLRSKLADVADAIAAFATDLGDMMSRVTVVTLSEFGRRVAENASGGTDHGHGTCVFVLGGAVAGGRFYGTWPGLAPAVLVRGDLPGRTDYRQVLAEVATGFLGAGSVSGIFPGLKAVPLGLLRA